MHDDRKQTRVEGNRRIVGMMKNTAGVWSFSWVSHCGQFFFRFCPPPPSHMFFMLPCTQTCTLSHLYHSNQTHAAFFPHCVSDFVCVCLCEKILRLAGGLERLKLEGLSNPVAMEIQDIIKSHIEKKWLPMFLSTTEFIERQKHQLKVGKILTT